MKVLADNTLLLISAAGILGLICGSFLNVIILRLPARLKFEWRQQCQEFLEIQQDEAEKPPGFILKSSHCPSCGTNIKPWHNIPLISWLLLKGRCASCSSKISIQYPLVELITGLAFVTLAYQLGPGLPLLAAAFFTCLLITMSVIDFHEQLLPDDLTYILLWLGLLLSIDNTFISMKESIIGAAAGYLSLWTIYHLFRLLTGKEGMGYGDFKLLAALGAWLGWSNLPLVILLSSAVGAIFGIAMMISGMHQRDKPMPFGPFIAMAGWISLLWGNDIISGYLSYAGF